MDIFYQNRNGSRIYLDREPYKMAKKYSLLNYEWDYSMDSYDGRPRMTGKRKSAKRNADIIVSAKSEMDCLHQVSTLSDFFDADVLAGMSGRLYVGSGYLRCFIAKNNTSDKYLETRKMLVEVEILPDGEDWIYESKYTFQPQETSDSGNNMDYPHDYPFDYYNGMSSQILLNEAISDADFEMVVYGPCENPEILIGNHKYHVNCQLETGEYLVINSLTKKIYKVKNDGEQVNQYNLQDRDWYVFQKIASGSHSVFWSGLFGFDITLYERRSEPKWS